MSELQVTWFLLIGVLLAGYAILDGFDLGVGFWHLFARKDEERRIFLKAIGPVWDGNEVWLLTAGGALFAAFPPVYASVFSGFYLALVLVLLGLIFRVVSIEFFLVSDWNSEPVGREGQALRWVPTELLDAEELLPADVPVIAALQRRH